jgi:poly(3-hydroxybutyrate) depolymerase
MRALPLVMALVASTTPCQEGPPSRSETQKLVAAFLDLDGKTEAGQSAQAEILARLELLPPLNARDVADWKKKILKEQQKGPKLEKGGRNWFQEDKKTKERRGLYIVGGETGRPKGLLIGLHGGGAGSGDAGSSDSMYSAAANKLGWVSICPEVLEKTEHGWTDSGTEEFVIDLVDCALRTWKIDPDKVFMAGHSMGGYGTWTLGAHHADRFAGLAPSAGAPTPLLGQGGVITGVIEGVIPSLRNVRIVIFQSTDDPRVPPGPNRKAVELLREAQKERGGYDFEYWEVGDKGHGLPDGGARALLEKIADQTRNPVPERVTWQPVVRWKRQFYWLWWDNPFTRAIVVADLDKAANKITMTCDNPRSGLAVLVDERIVDMQKEVTVVLNGNEVFRGVPKPTLPVLLSTGTRNDPDLMFSARIRVVE